MSARKRCAPPLRPFLPHDSYIVHARQVKFMKAKIGKKAKIGTHVIGDEVPASEYGTRTISRRRACRRRLTPRIPQDICRWWYRNKSFKPNSKMSAKDKKEAGKPWYGSDVRCEKRRSIGQFFTGRGPCTLERRLESACTRVMSC